MKSALVVCSLLVVGTCAAAPSLLPGRVDKAVRERIANGEYRAIVIALVDGDRSAVYGFGTLDGPRGPDGDTVFEIGSISKTFTATMLAKAVLDGHLALDEPVAKLLPGFTIPSRGGKEITLENLATQHSGLPRLPDNFAPGSAGDPYADYGGERMKAFLAGYTLEREPGASYEYSNFGAGLLGYALARDARMSYDALLHRVVLDPLGMHRSGVAMTGAMRAHLATGHDETGKPVPNWNFDALAGAGGIKSTGSDMLRYLQANMGMTKTPLYPAMRLAQKPRVDGEDAADPIGLIWMTRTASGNVVWHNGATGGFTSFVGFSADRRHGVVILSNQAANVYDLGIATLDPEAALNASHKAISVEPEALEAYAGSYQLTPSLVLRVFSDDGRLYGQATGQDALPLYASAADEFFARTSPIAISFKRDARGKVASLVLHQHGDHPAPRVAEIQAAVAIDAPTQAAYVGHYQLAPEAIFEITVKNGQLMSQLSGQSAFPIFASARDRFFYKVVDAQIEFERDAQGRVVALLLHQNGVDQRAKRIDSH